MPLIFAAALLVFVILYHNAQKKHRRIQQEPILQQWSEDALEYMLTWIIFQEIVKEVYDEWNVRGAPHPIGYYHNDFLKLGQEMYDGLYPAEEALVRAKRHLKELGHNRPLQCEQTAGNSLRRIRIFDFAYHLPPDRTYKIPYGRRCADQMYKGVAISEPAEDDWRRISYEDSSGIRHELRTGYSGGVFYHNENRGDW